MPKPTLPQGTRDFNAETVRKRNYIFSVIRGVFECYGFEPLETPAMENLETLMGKYGEEGDKLIFKVLNNGLHDPKNREKAIQAFENVMQGKSDKNLTERALRYDLTIPFARYVAMNQGQLTFPYKRYQLQPVWRADRPQKGRYREFYQCDADMVGSNSRLSDVEFAHIYKDVFEQLNLPVEIRINHRKILSALAEICGSGDKLTDITVAIDKLDKIGIQKVREELSQKGLEESAIDLITKYVSLEGNNAEKLEKGKELFAQTETGKAGIDELEAILEWYNNNSGSPLSIDFTLARGLNYYTGIIFEVKALGIEMGSIGGGGRYDDLTGLFDVPGIPGVGISFGVDRIYDVMESLQLFPQEVRQGTQVLFFNLGEPESRTAFRWMQQLRRHKVRCELYHETIKFDKQFKYADKKNIDYAVIIGSEELKSETCTLKHLKTGKQETLSLGELLKYSF